MPNYKKIVTLSCSAIAATGIIVIASSDSTSKFLLRKYGARAYREEGLQRNLMHHAQSKYITELYHVLSDNMSIVFDGGCGAVDAITEAGMEVGLHTLVLNGDHKSDSFTSASIDYLALLPTNGRLLFLTLSAAALRASMVQCLWRRSDRKEKYSTLRQNVIRKYLQTISEDELISLFEDILSRYEPHDLNADNVSQSSGDGETKEMILRSCSVLWNTMSLLTVSQRDMELLMVLKQKYPNVNFFISCNHGPLSISEEVPEYTLPLYSLPILGLAPLTTEERDETTKSVSKGEEESLEKVALNMTKGFWDDAKSLLELGAQRVKESMDSECLLDACIIENDSHVKETQNLLLALLSELSKNPSVDIVYLFTVLTGRHIDPLSVGSAGMMEMIQKDDNSSMNGIYVIQSVESLQTDYFLPRIFTNTTMGAIAFKEIIDNGHSAILQHLLKTPEIKKILTTNVTQSFVSNESIAQMPADESSFSMIRFARLYNEVQPSCAYTVINSLLSTGLIRMHLLRPVFCLGGWLDFISSLYLSPHTHAVAAFQAITSEKENASVISSLVTQTQRELRKPRQQFTNQYYIRQLESEYVMLDRLVDNYKEIILHDNSVDDVLQGLIELENLYSTFLLHSHMLIREERDYEESERAELVMDLWADKLSSKKKDLHAFYSKRLEKEKEKDSRNSDKKDDELEMW